MEVGEGDREAEGQLDALPVLDCVTDTVEVLEGLGEAVEDPHKDACPLEVWDTVEVREFKVSRVRVTVTVMVLDTLEVKEGDTDTVEEPQEEGEREGDMEWEVERENVEVGEAHALMEVDMEGEREVVGQRELEGEGVMVLREGEDWEVEEMEGEALTVVVRDRVRVERGDLDAEGQLEKVRDTTKDPVPFTDLLGVTVMVGEAQAVGERVEREVEVVDSVDEVQAVGESVQGCVVAWALKVAVMVADAQLEGEDMFSEGVMEGEEEEEVEEE